jgi:ABC-2 type transport system ATP-binding protein
MPIIEARHLVKKFKTAVAVDDLSFSVEESEIFGLLGPNGAGKTTTIRMLTTLLPPTSGEAMVAGCNILKQRSQVRSRIGMVFQDPALDRQLTGRENLDFHARMYGMNRELRRNRVREVLDLVELAGRENDRVEHYSGGMQRRLEIARGLMHAPKVLFLDEPTLGLDTQTRRKIWDSIRRLNRESKTTVILTTHYMEALDTPKNLKDTIGTDVVVLEMECGDCEILRKLDFVRNMVKHENRISLSMENGERKIPALLEFTRTHGIQVTSVELHKASLEDVFIRLTGSSLREPDRP